MVSSYENTADEKVTKQRVEKKIQYTRPRQYNIRQIDRDRDRVEQSRGRVYG